MDRDESTEGPAIRVSDLDIGYGDRTIIEAISFSVGTGEIFAIIGSSGSGKSTLLKYLIGLRPVPEGKIFIASYDMCRIQENPDGFAHFGVLYQSGALWSSMTLGENVALPIQRYHSYDREELDRLVRFKLALVGLSGFEDYYPSEISGGMVKRAGIARALALDPKILFLDEPSAGLDPLTARKLDDLILEIRLTLGTTIVLVTHEVSSIHRIVDRVAFLDGKSQSILAIGDPRKLAHGSTHSTVRDFLASNPGEKTVEKEIDNSLQINGWQGKELPSNLNPIRIKGI